MSSLPIARAAAILALGNAGSRILGLVREQVIAGLFGATAATDAFRVASRVPLALYDLLVGGMVSSALVPVFSSYLARRDPTGLSSVAATLLAGLVLLLGAVVLLLAALASPLVRLLAGGYPEEVQAMAADLVRLVLLSLVFMGLSGLLAAVLYARQRFSLPAAALLAYNGGIVVVALVLHEQLGIASLVVGVLAGSALQMVVQVPGLKGLGGRPRLQLRHPGVREVLRLYVPVALGLIVSTVGILIDTNLASRTGEGNLAAMVFATTLVQFPLGLVGGAVSSAVLPTLSRHAEGFATASLALGGPTVPPALEPPGPAPEAGALAAYRGAMGSALRLVLVAIVPAGLALVALREPVIRLLFQRGAFDQLAADRTAAAFLAYSPGLPAAALDQVLIFGYYARRRTLTPVLVGIMGVAVYLAAGLLLIGPWGMPGLALANSAQWVSHMLAMLVLTHRSIGGLAGLGLGGTALRAGLSAAVMAGMLVWVESLTGSPASTALLAAWVGGLLAAGGTVYAGLLALLSPQDARLLARAVVARFRREA